jgi:hypothetical protein
LLAKPAKLGGPPILEADAGGLPDWDFCERLYLGRPARRSAGQPGWVARHASEPVGKGDAWAAPPSPPSGGELVLILGSERDLVVLFVHRLHLHPRCLGVGQHGGNAPALGIG